jgi:copper transport protein
VVVIPAFFLIMIISSSFLLNLWNSNPIFLRASGSDSVMQNMSRLQHLKIQTEQFPIPSNLSWPYYPLFDRSRNVIWIGDTVIDSGRIWEFNITNNEYIEHKLNDIKIVTALALDLNNTIWYLDPLGRRLGFFNPFPQSVSGVYKIEINDTTFGMAIDDNNIIWITSPANGDVLRFDINTKTFKKPIHLADPPSRPLGIAFNGKDSIWIADELGSIISIPTNNTDKIYRYGSNLTYKGMLSPTAIIVSPNSNNIFVSNHNNKSIANVDIKAGRMYIYSIPTLGRPFGMAVDKYGDVWIAQHTSNRIFALEPSTGNLREIAIPDLDPYVYWMTSDSNGNIWLVEQFAGALRKIVIQDTPFY